MFFFVVLSSWAALPGQAQQPHARVSSEKTWPALEIGVEYWALARHSANIGSGPGKWYHISQTIPLCGR